MGASILTREINHNVIHSPEETNDIVYDRVVYQHVDRSACIDSDRLTLDLQDDPWNLNEHIVLEIMGNLATGG